MKEVGGAGEELVHHWLQRQGQDSSMALQLQEPADSRGCYGGGGSEGGEGSHWGLAARGCVREEPRRCYAAKRCGKGERRKAKYRTCLLGPHGGAIF